VCVSALQTVQVCTVGCSMTDMLHKKLLFFRSFIELLRSGVVWFLHFLVAQDHPLYILATYFLKQTPCKNAGRPPRFSCTSGYCILLYYNRDYNQERYPQHTNLLLVHSCYKCLQYLGYAAFPSVSPGPHHPNVLKRNGPQWSDKNHLRAESIKWEDRKPIMFFRGSG